MINLNILKAGNNCYYTNDEFNSVEDSIKNANKTITIFIGTDSAELVGNSNVVSIFGDSAIVLTNVTCIKQDHMKEY
jgi:DNA-binding beta-propeller fold protein YncE